MEYEITTGGVFYYLGPVQVRGIFTFRDKVDRDLLQQAVDRAMPRFPYFCVKAEKRADGFAQVSNDAPFVVWEREDPPSPGTAEVNGHLHTFGCWENRLYADFFHGIGDGRGTLLTLVKSVLYYYCRLRYGTELSVPGLITAGSEPSPGEYADPLARVPAPEREPVLFRRATESFVFPETPMPSGSARRVYTAKVKEEDFMRFTRRTEGSPAVIISLLLCRAIDKIHPVGEKPLVVALPADNRRELGCEKTAQYCQDSFQLIFSEKMRSLPFDTQVTGFRGQLFLQRDTDAMRANMVRYAEGFRAVRAAPTAEEKTAALAPLIYIVPGPCVSYMGPLRMGDIENYVTAFHGVIDPPGSLLAEVYAWGDQWSICLMSGLETDVYIQAFWEELRATGIPFTLEEPLESPARRLPDCFGT